MSQLYTDVNSFNEDIAKYYEIVVSVRFEDHDRKETRKRETKNRAKRKTCGNEEQNIGKEENKRKRKKEKTKVVQARKIANGT
ncbi:hypothetical protein NPIL_39721 [Nephila pilipes]|uniref:Uncharacterized protein n=1 Tax=Nephila pilipes TaxID=299642 RepID=A0A8X6NKH9_NEPPI|nr:hypothetical protein NPIL_39721 [Nephila pilipes]